LSFTSHINAITKKAFKMLGFINRNTINFQNIIALKTLFYALVRSHLEFGSTVWLPNYITYYLLVLLKMYNKFLKLLSYNINVPFTSNNSCNMRIIELGFISFEVRRKVADIMFIYDWLIGHIFPPELLSMIELYITNYRLRNLNLFHVPFYKNNYSSTSFFPRTLKLANLITDHEDFSLCHVLFLI